VEKPREISAENSEEHRAASGDQIAIKILRRYLRLLRSDQKLCISTTREHFAAETPSEKDTQNQRGLLVLFAANIGVKQTNASGVARGLP
jgi:hypothetical protein